MQFDENFFKTELKDGFEIPSMMKHAWAAQIELLEDIKCVCKKFDIQFFADYGTLLGAVRHRGFIPWDDDLDIGMLRSDFNRFLSVAPSELPENCRILNMHTESAYDDVMTRVVNSSFVTIEPAHLDKYHNCPFVVGIDIFPYDYIPRDRDELSTVVMILKALGEALKIIRGKEENSIKEEIAGQIGELCGISLEHDKALDRQLLDIYEKLTSMYTSEESDHIGIYASMVNTGDIDYCFDKEWFSSYQEMPFENTMIPVPAGYDAFLKKRYGDYMTHHISFAHDYPFYKVQIEEIRQYVEKNPQYAEMWSKYIT